MVWQRRRRKRRRRRRRRSRRKERERQKRCDLFLVSVCVLYFVRIWRLIKNKSKTVGGHRESITQLVSLCNCLCFYKVLHTKCRTITKPNSTFSPKYSTPIGWKGFLEQQIINVVRDIFYVFVNFLRHSTCHTRAHAHTHRHTGTFPSSVLHMSYTFFLIIRLYFYQLYTLLLCLFENI